MRYARFLFTAMLALCIVVTGFAPLSSLHAQDNTVTLMLSIPTTLGDVYSAKFIGQFEASHPGIKVQVNKNLASIPQAAYGLDGHFEAVQKYVTTGDVLYVTSGNLSSEDTAAGYYLDLAPLVNDDQTLNPDDFYPAIWQSYQWDRGIWALPVSADPYVLLYNPEAFDKAGLAYPTDKWTVDDLIDTARKLTGKDSEGKVTPGIDLLYYLQGYAFRAVLKNGIVDTSVIPNTPKFSDPELADLMTKWLQLDNEGAVGQDLAKAPMSVGPAIWLALTDQLFPGEKRLASMLPGGKAALSVDGFAISGGTQHPLEAYTLASWLSSRTEASNSGLASTPARKSLKGSAGSDEIAFKLDVSPEVQAVIDQSVTNGIPFSEMRFGDYLALAYSKMKTQKSDAAVALQQAETEAVKAQQQAVTRKDSLKTALVVATPIPSNDVAAGKIAIKFGLGNASPIVPNQDAWNKLITDFVASDTNVAKISFESSADALEKLATKYDCFYLPYNGLAPEKLAKILPLDPFTSADPGFDKTDMVSGVLAQMTRDNKLYALPVDISPDVLKYDSKAFEQAGVPAPGLLWTTDQFNDAIKQLTKYNGDKPAVAPVNTFGSYIMNMIVAYGGLPIDYRTTPPTVNFSDPATVDAIRQIADLAKAGYFKYHTLFAGQLDLEIAPPTTLIKPATLSAYSIASMLDFGAKNDALKLTLYPRGSNYTPVSYTVGALYISATATAPDACYRWMTTIAKNPNLFSSMPARRSLINDPSVATVQGADVAAIYKQIADLLQDPNTISLPAFSAGTSTNEIVLELELFKALDKYMAQNSSADLDAVLKDAQTSAEAFLACSANIPPLDMTSTESQKAYFNATKECAVKSDTDLAPFFAGVKTN